MTVKGEKVTVKGEKVTVKGEKVTVVNMKKNLTVHLLIDIIINNK